VQNVRCYWYVWKNLKKVFKNLTKVFRHFERTRIALLNILSIHTTHYESKLLNSNEIDHSTSPIYVSTMILIFHYTLAGENFMR
jgi:hypothetical protein